MKYEYDTKGQLAKAYHASDPAHAWTWTYDQRGRVVTATDPDAGTTSTTYDHRDRLLTTTNARNVTVWNGYDELSRPIAQRLGGDTGTLLADYEYDKATLGKGLPSKMTRYTDGLPYTQSIGGYTNDYQPTSTTLTLPASVASTYGLPASYTYSYSFTDTGLTESATLPAVGNLPSEKLLVRYTADGLPLSVSGKDWYGSETEYSPYGQVVRSTLGAHPTRVWALTQFDPSSGELTRQQVYREKTGDKTLVSGNLVSNRSYTYDDAGNVTGIREQSTGIDERQCFTYDPLGQLMKAWTDKNTTCSSSPLAADGTLNVTAGPDGAGYWQEYEYDLVGNRKKLVEKDLTGNTAKDATTDYKYGAADGSQPHTLTNVKKKYVTPDGAAVTAEAERLYEKTGETKTVTSIDNGDKQELAWTYDGQVERISGEGSNGKTSYVGLDGKCIDLSATKVVANQPIQLYTCNGTLAQSWKFQPKPGQADAALGTMTLFDDWCLQPAANTAGSAFQLQKCTGAAGQQLRRGVNGQFTHPASGLCLAVKDAAIVNGTPLVLATCATAAAQQWSPQNETRYVYGPGGARLLKIQGQQATLLLGEAQVTAKQGGFLVRTQRTYATPGGAVIRTTHGGSNVNTLSVVTGDHQGSPYAEVILNNDASVQIYKQDPFGNPRGAAKLATQAQTNAGFLGAVRDDPSGYVPLGARLYDPEVGRFISADPVVDLADPLQSNGYAYAHNNPVTMADPTGLSIALTASEMAAALAGAGLSAAQVADAQATMNKSLTDVILGAAWGILSEILGIGDAIACFGGDMWACGSMILSAIPWAKVLKARKIAKAIDRTIEAIQAFKKARQAAEAVIAAARAAEKQALNAKKLAIERAKKAAQAAKRKAADKVNTISNKASNATKKTGNSVQKDAQARGNPGGSSAGRNKGNSKPANKTGGSNRSTGGSSGDRGGDDGGTAVS